MRVYCNVGFENEARQVNIYANAEEARARKVTLIYRKLHRMSTLVVHRSMCHMRVVANRGVKAPRHLTHLDTLHTSTPYTLRHLTHLNTVHDPRTYTTRKHTRLGNIHDTNTYTTREHTHLERLARHGYLHNTHRAPPCVVTL